MDIHIPDISTQDRPVTLGIGCGDHVGLAKVNFFSHTRFLASIRGLERVPVRGLVAMMLCIASPALAGSSTHIHHLRKAERIDVIVIGHDELTREVQIAGGYTSLANHDSALVTRASEEARPPVEVKLNTRVRPGDTIEIERW